MPRSHSRIAARKRDSSSLELRVRTLGRWLSHPYVIIALIIALLIVALPIGCVSLFNLQDASALREAQRLTTMLRPGLSRQDVRRIYAWKGDSLDEQIGDGPPVMGPTITTGCVMSNCSRIEHQRPYLYKEIKGGNAFPCSDTYAFVVYFDRTGHVIEWRIDGEAECV